MNKAGMMHASRFMLLFVIVAVAVAVTASSCGGSTTTSVASPSPSPWASWGRPPLDPFVGTWQHGSTRLYIGEGTKNEYAATFEFGLAANTPPLFLARHGNVLAGFGLVIIYLPTTGHVTLQRSDSKTGGLSAPIQLDHVGELRRAAVHVVVAH